MVPKSFVNISCLRWLVFGGNLVNDGFVIIGEAFKNVFDLVIMFKRLTKESKGIKTSSDALDILVDCHIALVEDLELILELTDVAAGRISICGCELFPNLGCSGGAGYDLLEGGRDRADESTID